MAAVIIKENTRQLAEAAAEIAVETLNEAIAAYGQAVWVLAGGSTPIEAYRLMASIYAKEINWAKVTLMMGDERCVPAGHADSNWVQASAAMIDHLAVPEANKLRPPLGLVAEKAAALYESSLSGLSEKSPGIPRLSHVWFGIGDDGHTFSLFPGHTTLSARDSLVVPVHDSPKPPPDRISLSLKALEGAENALIMVSGPEKAAVVARAIQGDESLPITLAAATIEIAGGQVTWLLDKAAASRLTVKPTG